LKCIDVSSNEITHEGAITIAEKSVLKNLEVLDLRNNKISNSGFQSIINSTLYPKIRDVRLDINKVQEVGAKQLTYSCNLETLEKLSIRGNHFGEKGCLFVQVYALRNLMVLNMSRNDIKDEGVANLAGASYLRNLTKLYIDDNNLTA